ncbi:FliM/FliN family flagellar motor C-terminal domain-containing protein [Frigidibacter sp. ROC022]|uniref:FliM/FliN family flagellar motor C-terminal domain-containing protein n=1 Tax=Frigidibacter sp. ROC022 TaxID=2971796 RepID=UPI00215B736E|nr:FliM/FliN family flagellar motor C-terminal domain-containing protein [Frigidibacter sp. ROC022]MCR8724351.1 FliM/FliN family flagellar motor C-terminal domain-containing protein [Frigidibacter sp. ROC022]
MDDSLPPGPPVAESPFGKVPVEITVAVGRARPRVRELLALKGDSVLPLDRRIDDPVELFIGGELIGTGELIELEGEQAGQLAVRLVEVRKPGGGA